MKNLYLILFVFICYGCSSLLTKKSLFNEYEVSRIPRMSNGMEYREDYVDYHFPEQGTIQTPISNLSIKYDTLSRYGIIINGWLYFEKNDSVLISDNLNKIKIGSILVVKVGKGLQKITKNNCPSRKKLPIPYVFLKKIKDDYLYITRNSKIRIKKQNEECDSFPIVLSYKLY